ncbi:MAG: HDOD domain-containing protein [Nitrospinae bacterium]|nr:HDOD domain-containing protein [Nitrospinota bacterium]
MNNALKKAVEKINQLPTIPEVAQRVLGAIDSEHTSTSELESIIVNDPTIASKVLSVSRTTFFGGNKPPESIKEAIVRIGFGNVKNIAVGISLMTLFDDKKRHLLDYETIFKHSLDVAYVTAIINRKLKVQSKGDIFLSALLHDIGYLAINCYFQEQYKEVLKECLAGSQLSDAEVHVLGFTHSEIGAWLASVWKLPEVVIEVIKCHHDISGSKNFSREVALIHIADFIAANAFFYVFKNDNSLNINKIALKEFNLNEEEVAKLQLEVIETSFT